jgi:hypothetical protein
VRHADALETELSHRLTEKVRPPPARLDEGHRPIGSSQLQYEPRHPGAAPEVEERARRLGENREQEQRVDDQVPHLVALGPIARQPRDTIPATEFVEVRPRPPLEPLRERDPQALGRELDGAPGAPDLVSISRARRRLRDRTRSPVRPVASV